MKLSFISNARFNPFTYDEMAKPLMQYKEYYDKNEELATKLSEQAADWESRAPENEQIKNYANDLRNKAEELSRHGMSPALRADLQNMRVRYKKEVTPIEEAYNLRNKLAEEQRLAVLKDPSLRFDKEYAVEPIENLINNPTANYRQWSLNDLYKQSSVGMGPLLESSKNQPRFIQNKNGFTTIVEGSGYTDTDIEQALMFNENTPMELIGSTPVELIKHVSNLRDQYDYDRMSDIQKKEFDNAVRSSMNAARNRYNYKVMRTPVHKTADDEYSKILTQYRIANQRADLERKGYRFNPQTGQLENISGSSNLQSPKVLGTTSEGDTITFGKMGNDYKVRIDGYPTDIDVKQNGEPYNLDDDNPYTGWWKSKHDNKEKSSNEKAKSKMQPLFVHDANLDRQLGTVTNDTRSDYVSELEEAVETADKLGGDYTLQIWSSDHDMEDEQGAIYKSSDKKGKQHTFENMPLTENQLSNIQAKLDKDKTGLTTNDVYVVKYKNKGWLFDDDRIVIIPKGKNLFGLEDSKFNPYYELIRKNDKSVSSSESNKIEKTKSDSIKADSIRMRQLDDETL